MSQSDQGNLASDIITYIGVPLAVLGVLPILYNTVATLAALSRIKRMLRHSQMSSSAYLTRSDVVNRVIEVELPRYAVTPPDRLRERAAYWQLPRQPSQIPGGTWTTFNWKTRAIGVRTQRVEYADQLRQPQVDAAFDELVAYLLDLGAVPDPRGWRILRSTGLWAPTGSALMLAPDGATKALTVAPLDDSDGHLSLRVTWSQSWISRDPSFLPPYWVRLPPPPPLPPLPKTVDVPTSDEGSASSSSAHDVPTADAAPAEAGETKKEEEKEALPKESLDPVQKQAERNRSSAITCRISVEGLVRALCEDDNNNSSSSSSSSNHNENENGAAVANEHAHSDYHYQGSSSSSQGLYVEHLRIRAGGSPGRSDDGVWFASVATAYGTSSQTVLWNYRIPGEVLGFARRETVPCGVLVLLGIVDEERTPDWGGPRHDGRADQLDRFVRRNRERQIAVQAESKMAPAQREIAVSQRMQREIEQRMQDMGDQQRLDAQRREMRESAALQSPKWDTKIVAEHCLRWLQQRQQQLRIQQQERDRSSSAMVSESADDSISIGASQSVRDAAGALLHRMVLDGAFAASVCATLDLWKAWADNGGMRRSDLSTLRERPALFAQAALLVAVVKDATVAAATHEETLAADLQECLRMWRTVRLG